MYKLKRRYQREEEERDSFANISQLSQDATKAPCVLPRLDFSSIETAKRFTRASLLISNRESPKVGEFVGLTGPVPRARFEAHDDSFGEYRGLLALLSILDC